MILLEVEEAIRGNLWELGQLRLHTTTSMGRYHASYLSELINILSKQSVGIVITL